MDFQMSYKLTIFLKNVLGLGFGLDSEYKHTLDTCIQPIFWSTMEHDTMMTLTVALTGNFACKQIGDDMIDRSTRFMSRR